MEISKIPKTNRSRLLQQDTYKIVCEDPEKHIRAVTTLKAGNETGSGIDEFTHVALGALRKFKKPCVIKVHYTKSAFTKREIDITTRLKECPYALQHICHYSCHDDKLRWMDNLKNPKTTCKGSKDDLTFMIMPYIENGDVCDFLKTASAREIKSLFILSGYAIMHMAKQYGVSHGDLNSGNILIQRVKRKPKTIKNNQQTGVTNVINSSQAAQHKKIPIPPVRNLEESFQRMIMSSTRVV